MNWARAISGLSLSFIFLLAIFFALQGIWSLKENKSLFLANILIGASSGEQNINFGEGGNSGILSPHRNWEIPEFDLGAEAGVAVEVSSSQADKILFKKNSYNKLPIASLTKLMTAVVCLENYDPQQTSKMGDKEIQAADLLYMMLIESNNEAAVALSEIMAKEKFLELMNLKAKELSMENTFFADPTGLSAENVSSADDLVKLAKYILSKHPEIARISRTKEYDLPGYGKLINTDQLLGEIPEIIAGKTGFTNDAKGCLLLLLDNSKKDSYLIYVVLGAGDRFSEMKKMIDWVKIAYSWQS